MHRRYMHTITLGVVVTVARFRVGLLPPGGAWDLGRGRAVNALSYSTGSRSQTEAGRASEKGPLSGGSPSAKTGFADAEPTPSRVPAGRLPIKTWLGRILQTTLFSLRLRVAQHFT